MKVLPVLILSLLLLNGCATNTGPLLGIRSEQQLGDRIALASYELLLKNNFADSVKAGQMNKPGGR